jgi:hypothetical protein
MRCKGKRGNHFENDLTLEKKGMVKSKDTYFLAMQNHIHVIAASESEDGLRLAIGEARLRYTTRINFREG